MNLVHLNGGIDEKCEIEDADSNDLNSIFEAESIIAENDQEDVGENEERKVCRDRPCLSLREYQAVV